MNGQMNGQTTLKEYDPSTVPKLGGMPIFKKPILLDFSSAIGYGKYILKKKKKKIQH